MRSGLFGLAFIMAVACGDSEGISDDGPVGEFIPERPCPPDSLLTYDNFGERMMLDHCTGCHGDEVARADRQGAPPDINLTTHEQVQDWLELVYEVSADESDIMPVVDNVDPVDRYLLGDWLACGAP